MSVLDDYRNYRRIFTSARDGEAVAWWYFGTTTVLLPDHLELVVNHVETVMIYCGETLGEGDSRIPWWEIGVFRDAATGELATDWVNPVTGVTVKAPRSFEEGPAAYTLKVDQGELRLGGVQSYAKSLGTDVRFDRVGDRIRLSQEERKIRAFPGPDNAIADFNSPDAVRTVTRMQIFVDRAALDSDIANVPATGMYSFEMSAPPAWMGFQGMEARCVVKGVMQKFTEHAAPSPTALARLRQVFPHRFKDAVIAPNWG